MYYNTSLNNGSYKPFFIDSYYVKTFSSALTDGSQAFRYYNLSGDLITLSSTGVLGSHTINQTTGVWATRLNWYWQPAGSTGSPSVNFYELMGFYDETKSLDRGINFTAYNNFSDVSLNILFNITMFDENQTLLNTFTGVNNGFLWINLTPYEFNNYTFKAEFAGDYASTNYSLEYNPTGTYDKFYYFTDLFQTFPVPTINISFIDEETGIKINNVSYELIFNNFALSSNTTTGNAFIELNNSGDLEINYVSPGYDERKYLVNVNSESAEEIELFLLNSSTTGASLVTFQVTNEDGDLLPDAQVSLQRGFIDNNVEVFKTVAMDDSDFNGEGGLFLVKSTIDYKFLITYNNNVCLSSEKSTIFGSSINLVCTIGEDIVSGWISAYNVESNISFNKTEYNFTAEYANINQEINEICFKITQLSGLGNNIINSSCLTTNSGSITLGIPNESIGNFEATLTISLSNKEVVINSLTKKLTNAANNFGSSGIFYAFMIVLICAFLGLSVNVEMSIVMTMVGLVFSSMLGLLPIGFGTISILIVISGILLYSFKRGVEK